MDPESDSLRLVDYNFQNGRSRSSRKRQSEAVSDSELDKQNGNMFETTLRSDICDENLPSVRAHLAASRQYKASQLSGRHHKETTPLLDETSKNGNNLEPTSLQKEASKTSGYEKLDGRKRSKWAIVSHWYTIFKVAFLTLFFCVCVFIEAILYKGCFLPGSVLFSINEELEENVYFISVHNQRAIPITYGEEDASKWKFVSLVVDGPLLDFPYNPVKNNGSQTCSDYVFVCGDNANGTKISMPCEFFEDKDEKNYNCHSFQLVEGFNLSHSHRYFNKIEMTLDIHLQSENQQGEHNFSIIFFTESEETVEFQASVLGEKLEQTFQVIIAAVILIFVYVLIGFDIVHRMIAAIVGSTCTLGVLSMLGKRPTLLGVIEWIDLDTICLLFGMMTMVAIFSQTGFFDYSAVKAYKLARGRVWPLITLLCFFAAIVSAFLDNVTTILLLTPVSIRLCQVLNLDPRPVLIAEVVFSNVGGTATAIGDPPNVIIVSNKLIKETGIDFSEFTLHLVLGIIPCIFVAYGLLAVIHKIQYIHVKNKDPPHISELKREVAIWERTAQRLNVVSLEERAIRDALIAKASEVRQQLDQEVNSTSQSALDMWQKNLTELESRYRITNWVLLTKSSIVLLVVILMFFVSNLIPVIELDLGWIAIFGAIVLLLLADIQDLENILHKIEWGTLLFFAALFILMEGIGELGLIRFIGDTMVSVINMVPPEQQMLVSIILIVWVSAIASSFIDNIPFTTAMIPVIVDLANSRDVCLTIRPLVWSLAIGACLGGNGTLIGASANVVCAGIAEQSGYKITFFGFFKIGFPMMLCTSMTAMIYLLIAHSWIGWDIGEDTKQCIEAMNSA